MYFSFFPFFTVSRHNLGPTVSPIFLIFHDFCFLPIVQVLHFAFLIFHVFACFLPHSRSNSVCVSFCTFYSFLAIYQVLQCGFLIFHVFQYFSPYSRSFSVFYLIFHVFHFFSPQSMSYSVYFSFFTFLSVSRYIPCHTVFLSHFPRF